MDVADPAKRRQSPQQNPQSLHVYAKVIATWPGLVIVAVLAVVAACGIASFPGVGFQVTTFPDFSEDPIEGFETRGTYISGSFKAVGHLNDEVEKFELNYVPYITVDSTTSTEEEDGEEEEEDGEETSISENGINSTDVDHNVSSVSVTHEPPEGELTAEQNDTDTRANSIVMTTLGLPPLKYTTHSDDSVTDDDNNTRREIPSTEGISSLVSKEKSFDSSTSSPVYTYAAADAVVTPVVNTTQHRRKRSEEQADLQECASDWIGDYMIPKLVFKAKDGHSLLSAEVLREICEIDDEYIRFYKASSPKACPSASIALYIGALFGKQCYDITDGDLTALLQLLRRCSPVYREGSLNQDCFSNGVHPGSCPGIDDECQMYNAVFLIFDLFTDREFFTSLEANAMDSSQEVQLKYTSLVVSSVAGDDILNLFTDRLESASQRSWTTVDIVGIDIGDYKYTLFEQYLMEDIYYFVLAAFLIFLIMLLYLQSVLLTIATNLNVSFSFILTYFIYHVVCRFKFFPFMNLLSILVLIGVSADDVFIFIDTWCKERSSKLSVEIDQSTAMTDHLKSTFKHALLTIFVTSITTSAAFFSNAISDITAVSCFAIFSGIAIITNFVLMITFFPAFVVLAERSRLWCPCLNFTSRWKTTEQEECSAVPVANQPVTISNTVSVMNIGTVPNANTAGMLSVTNQLSTNTVPEPLTGKVTDVIPDRMAGKDPVTVPETESPGPVPVTNYTVTATTNCTLSRTSQRTSSRLKEMSPSVFNNGFVPSSKLGPSQITSNVTVTITSNGVTPTANTSSPPVAADTDTNSATDRQTRCSCKNHDSPVYLLSIPGRMIDWLFGEALPYIINEFWFIWLFLTTGLGVGGAILVFYEPKLSLPSSETFQLFQKEHPIEQFEMMLQKEFRYSDADEMQGDAGMRTAFIWGLKNIDNGNHFNPKSTGHIEYDDKFDLSSKEAQLWLHDQCTHLQQNASFLSDFSKGDVCLIPVFAETVKSDCSAFPARYHDCCEQTFPLEPDVFDKCLGAFFYILPYFTTQRPVDYGLFDKGGNLKVYIIDFYSNYTHSTNFNYMGNFHDSLKDFLDRMLADAPASVKGGWFFSNLAFYDLQRALSKGTYIAFGMSLVVALFVILSTTLNLVLSLYAVINIGFGIACTVGILVLLGWELNILESVTLSLAIGLSIDFSIHYAVAYRLSNHLNPPERVKYALHRVGPAIVMAALTTFLAGSAIMGTRILAYSQLGTFLMVVMSVSWFYATFFFLPLCSVLGPKGTCAQVICHRCNSKSYSLSPPISDNRF